MENKENKKCPHCGGDITPHSCGERIIFWCNDCGSNNPNEKPNVQLCMSKTKTVEELLPVMGEAYSTLSVQVAYKEGYNKALVISQQPKSEVQGVEVIDIVVEDLIVKIKSNFLIPLPHSSDSDEDFASEKRLFDPLRVYFKQALTKAHQQGRDEAIDYVKRMVKTNPAYMFPETENRFFRDLKNYKI